MPTIRRKGGGWKSQEGGRQGSDLIDALQSGIRWQKTTGSHERILVWRVTQWTSCVLSGSSGQRWKMKDRLGGGSSEPLLQQTTQLRGNGFGWERSQQAGETRSDWEDCKDYMRYLKCQAMCEDIKMPIVTHKGIYSAQHNEWHSLGRCPFSFSWPHELKTILPCAVHFYKHTHDEFQ